jgi:hypothetical protein
MHKNATKCNETLSKWCKNKHGTSKIIDTFETYLEPLHDFFVCVCIERSMMYVDVCSDYGCIPVREIE